MNQKRAWESIGEISYGPTESEKSNLNFRRSIYSSKKIKKGEKLDNSNIKIIRPAKGIEPKFYNIIIGKRANRDLEKGTALTWEMF